MNDARISHEIDSAIKNLVEFRRAFLERNEKANARRQLKQTVANLSKLASAVRVR